jgi:Peptidase propeptide and YPEB domain
VDAQTGLVRNPEKLSESQVKDLLKQRGYSDVSDVRKDGDHFSANAKQAGQDVKLKIDAEQGTVTPQNS